MLALDVAGKASSMGGTANGQKPLSRPDRLDRLQRRLGFAPLPFVCLIWNFVSNMWPNVAYKTWIYVYLVTIVGLLPFKVSRGSAACWVATPCCPTGSNPA